MNGATSHPLWYEAEGLRIWRCPDSSFYQNELDRAADVYTDAVFTGIAAAGFNAVWLRGKLREVMDSTVFPMLNDPAAAQRRANLRTIIQRGRRHGVKVFLFFNEPLALRVDDPFWQTHPHLAGQQHRDYGADHDCASLCTSQPIVREFMRQAIDSLLDDAPGLGGFILITASEYHTHCWSHHVIHALNDGCTRPATQPVQCPRCREREPAEIVGELVTIWRDAIAARSPGMPVLCWNWSWSMWYPDPQSQVIARLPTGVAVQADFERGMQVTRRGRTIPIDEYSLSVTGPSTRFVGTRLAAAEHGLPVYAKLQLGTTHELATVPNLPLLEQVHGKLAGLTREGIAGFMGTWNFGCSLTLNTAAVGQYLKNPVTYADRDGFLHDLAHAYFGEVDDAAIRSAWHAFGQAFEHYPFSMLFLYWSVVNYAPAYPLTPHYEARPLGGSWEQHVWGDRLEDSVPEDQTVTDIAAALADVATGWQAGLDAYDQALCKAAPDPAHHLHQRQELSCARMIGVQIRCAANIYRFHAWRLQRMQALGLHAPCTVPLDDDARILIRQERELAGAALDLCRHDTRLGMHQECQAAFYDVASIARKIALLDRLLAD